MPELPEVEAVVRTLRPMIAGQQILRCEVIHQIAIARPRTLSKMAAAMVFSRRVKYQRIIGVSRFGKYVVIQLDKGCIVAHFRLDGKFVWSDNSRLRGHVDVALHLANGTLGYVDPRHLGRMLWTPRAEDVAGIAALGPDPLSTQFTPSALRGQLGGSVRPLRTALMDPETVAGLGNIYSNEALWRARLDPRRAANSLSDAECLRLHKSIVEVLRRALECCLHPRPDFRQPDWWFAGLEKIIRVYDHEGKPCARCGAKIRRFRQGGRSAFVCLRCQK